MGTNEIRWAESHARPRMNFQRSLDHPEKPADYISLLKKYLALAPYLLPLSAQDGIETPKTISHPDLHLSNIFVDPDTKRLTHIIDWQSASVSEPFFQRSFPQMLEPIQKVNESNTDPTGNNDSQLPKKDSDASQDPLDYYLHLLKETDPQRWAVQNETLLSIRTKPTSLVIGTWDREDLFSFRHSLISVLAHWDSLMQRTQQQRKQPAP